MEKPTEYTERRGSIIWYDEKGNYRRLRKAEFDRIFKEQDTLFEDDY